MGKTLGFGSNFGGSDPQGKVSKDHLGEQGHGVDDPIMVTVDGRCGRRSGGILYRWPCSGLLRRADRVATPLYQADIEKLKSDRKAFPTHISFSALPEEDQFKQLSIQSKHLIDTIKMIAYRVETAMVQILREITSQQDCARKLVKGVYDTEIDLVPDENEKTLTVFLHHLPSHSSDKSVQHLCEELTKTETIFPGTNFRLIYKLGSAQNPVVGYINFKSQKLSLRAKRSNRILHFEIASLRSQ